MNFTEAFNNTEQIYQDTCKKVADPKNFFFTQYYRDLRKVCYDISSRLNPLLNSYIKVIMNEATDPDLKIIKSHMCYPTVHLKIKDNKDFPKENYKKVYHTIDTTVRLGLMVHLFLVKSPTREKGYAKADLSQVKQEWAGRIMRSDRIMRKYDNDVKKLPGKIFDSYFKEYVEPLLKEDLGLTGFLKMKKEYNYFRRLYFSGILLGLENDVASRLASK